MAPRVPSLLRQLLYRISLLGGIREEVAQGRSDWGEKEDRAEGAHLPRKVPDVYFRLVFRLKGRVIWFSHPFVQTVLEPVVCFGSLGSGNTRWI